MAAEQINISSSQGEKYAKKTDINKHLNSPNFTLWFW